MSWEKLPISFFGCLHHVTALASLIYCRIILTMTSSQRPDQEATKAHQYHIYRTWFSQHYDVSSNDDRHPYYVNISSINFQKPDLIMRIGNDRNSPIVAACRLPRFSSDFKVCLGDPSDANSAEWEEMVKKAWDGSIYQWEMNISAQNSDISIHSPVDRTSFLWKRTQSIGVDKTPSALTTRNYKLINQQTSEIVAIFTGEKTVTKCGALQINVDYGLGFDRMVLITCLALYEKIRRRHNRRRHSGGGGGS